MASLSFLVDRFNPFNSSQGCASSTKSRQTRGVTHGLTERGDQRMCDILYLQEKTDFHLSVPPEQLLVCPCHLTQPLPPHYLPLTTFCLSQCSLFFPKSPLGDDTDSDSCLLGASSSRKSFVPLHSTCNFITACSSKSSL